MDDNAKPKDQAADSQVQYVSSSTPSVADGLAMTPVSNDASAKPDTTASGEHPGQAMSPSGAPIPPAMVTPHVAGDSDTIEQEWIVKVKEIVEATKNDPYQQNKQLAAIKADYMHKRYNKTIKLSD